MDRSIVYTSALPRTVDFLNTNLFAMLGLSYAMEGCLGYTGSIPAPPYVHGMQCTPTIPSADLNVHVNTGAIYAVDNIDSSAYSDLGTNTGSVLKQGLLQVPVTLAITPPGTPGYSQIYLVEVILNDVDDATTVLPYYNASNPAQPYSGPANSGTSQYTTRLCTCAVTLKAGVAAPTGTQTIPSPDIGYAGLYAVTVTFGQTQITGANIATLSNAPFFPTLPSIPVHIQNGDWISADDLGNQNAVNIQPFPAITGLQKYQKFRFKVRITNSGPSTLTVNGFTGSLYLPGSTPPAFPANALLINTIVEATCDGINFELTSTAITINNNSYTSSGPSSGLTNIQVFTSSGTYIPTVGAIKALVFATGGGAGGSGATCNVGGGGGAGATAIASVSLSGVASVPVTIGAGGNGVGVTFGGLGGQTSFGSYAIAAGGGPAALAAGGGFGGNTGTGLVILKGGDGAPGEGVAAVNVGVGGVGGASFWGGGGRGVYSNFQGSTAPAGNGEAFGSGGGGAGGNNANGANGVVVILEF